MKKVMVLVEFRDKETGTIRKPGTEFTVSEERLEAIRSVQENLVQVLGDAEPEAVEPVMEAEPVEEVPEEVAPVQPKTKK